MSVQIVTTLSLAVSLVAPAEAQLKPNSPEVIASAATDCWTASGQSTIDEARLQQLGWAAGSIRSPDGKTIDNPLRIFGKQGSSVVLMIMNTPTMTACTIMSRVKKPTDIGATAQLLFSKLKAIDPAVKGGRGGKPGEIVYLSLPRIAELVATGTKEKPGTRIVVGYSFAEKK